MIDEAIDGDIVEYVEDLEHKVMMVKLESPPDFIPTAIEFIPIDAQIENLLNDGWQIYNDVVCPPFVMLFFSRERNGEE